MNQTPNYQLNQWEKTDRIRMEDFNADNAKIEAALEALSGDRVYIGSYVGNNASTRTIQLPFAPKFAIIMGHYSSNAMIAILHSSLDFYILRNECGSSPNYNLKLVNDTLVVQNIDWNNMNGKTVHYILVR